MRITFIITIILITIYLFISCKKEKKIKYNMSISGYVVDEINHSKIPNIDISIDGIKPPTGFQLDGKRENMGNCTTNDNGYFSLSFNKMTSAKRYELILNKISTINYVYTNVDFDTSQLRQLNNNVNIPLSPTTFMKIHIKNTTPINNQDYISLDYYCNLNGWRKVDPTDEDLGAISANHYPWWTGMDVNTIRTINTGAEKYTFIYWSVTKNGIINSYKDSIFCMRNQIPDFQINY